MTRRFESSVLPPSFEVLEPRLLLSGFAPAAAVVVATPLPAYPVLAEEYKQWDWSGTMDIPDGPSGAWVGVDCLTPGTIPTGAAVTHVSIHYEVTHPYVGDLQIQLYDSTHTWSVRTNEGGSADNLNETRDELVLFDGDTPLQDWHFRVRDTAGYDVGTLDAIQLLVYYDASGNTPPDISGLPDITLDEDTSFPSVGGSAPASIEPQRLGFDGDTAKFAESLGAAAPLGDATPTGTSFLVTDAFGGTWSDAEKTAANTDDDLMCWAAAASNMLQWTGWGNAGGMTNADQIFAYYQAHWSDQGGLMQYGWNWWFTGSNPSQGWSGWSQVESAGGDFWPTYSFPSYFHAQDADALALSAIDQFSRAGDGVTLGIYGPGGHAITCWGFNYNPSNPTDYYGIWITDSDDDKSSNTPPDRLRYYEVKLSSGRWYLQNYYGTSDWYIGTVQALDRKPGVAPPPTPAPSDVDLWQYASDAETPDDQLAFAIVGNTNANCGVSISGNRYIHVDPVHNWNGFSDVTVRVSDGVLTHTDTFRITVNPVNDAPTIAGLPDRNVLKNGSALYTIYLPSYASDPETASSALSYAIVGNTNPSCGASIAGGLYVSLAPASGWTGWSDVTVRVSDGQYTATDVFRVTVSNPVVDLSGALTPVVFGAAGPMSYQLVQLRVTNSGSATAAGFVSMDLYASGDGDVTTGADDYRLNHIRPYIYLTPGATGYYYFSYLVPSGIPAGTYDLVAVVDADNNVTESNESNNTVTLADRFTMRNPDLTAGFAYLSVPSTPGAWGYALVSVRNSGSGLAYGPADIQLWATGDGDITSGTDDALLVTLHNYWLVLPAGVTGYYAALFRVPSGLAGGNYSVMAFVDSSNKIVETNDLNNCGFSSKQYALGLAPAAVADVAQAPSPVIAVAAVADAAQAPSGAASVYAAPPPSAVAAVAADAACVAHPPSGVIAVAASLSPQAALSAPVIAPPRASILTHRTVARSIFASLPAWDVLDVSL